MGDESCSASVRGLRRGEKEGQVSMAGFFSRADEEGWQIQIKSRRFTMCFGSVSCRHLFHGTLENTHRIQPHQNSPSGQAVISGLLDFSMCVCVCTGYFQSVKYLSQTAAALISICQGIHYAQVNIKPFFGVVKKKITAPFTTRGVDDRCSGLK